MDTLSRTAKLLDKICNVIYWLLLICMVVVLIVTAILGFLIANNVELLRANQSYTLTLGRLELLLAPGVMADITSEGFEPFLFWTAVFSLASMPVYFVMLLTVRDILGPFIRREPFHETVAKDLKRLSILVVIDTTLNWISTGLMNHMTQNYYDLHKLFIGDQAFGDKIITVGLADYTIDLTPFLFAAALYLLSKVFRYGEELQQLSDETL